MAAHRTSCGKVMKYGIQIEDSLNINRSKFGKICIFIQSWCQSGSEAVFLQCFGVLTPHSWCELYIFYIFSPNTDPILYIDQWQIKKKYVQVLASKCYIYHSHYEMYSKNICKLEIFPIWVHLTECVSWSSFKEFCVYCVRSHFTPHIFMFKISFTNFFLLLLSWLLVAVCW